MARTLLAAALALAAARAAFAQGTAEDYARSRALAERFRGKVFRAEVRPRWSPDGERLAYRVETAAGRHEYFLADASTGERRPAFDPVRMAEALSKATGKEVRADRLPVDEIEPLADGIWIGSGRSGWRCDLATYALAPAGRPERPGAGEPRRPADPSPREKSPDGRWTVLLRDLNLWLRDAEGKEHALTDDGTADDAWSPRVHWSPDSKRLVALRTRKGEDRMVTLVESSPKDQLQPRVHTLKYAKPGDVLPVARPHLFEVETRRRVPVPDALFPNPWSVSRIRWDADGRRFTFLYNQRGHQVLRVVAVDAATGEARALVNEESATFVDYAHKLFLHPIEAAGEFLWMSERDGWNHLYLYDARTGAVKNQVTKGPWVVRGVDRVDEKAREVWFRAGGIRPGQDPYHIHFARVGFDGTGLVVLTEGDGTHRVEFSPDRRHFVDTYSRADLPPVTELRRSSDGALVCGLERADASALRAAGWRAPERFAAPGRDGATGIWGLLFRPTNFDPAKRYPVVENIYAGPQGAHVPKGFREVHPSQEMAELGFIVVQIDGMGTSGRSKAFHDVCWKNLGDSGFPDRIAWIKAAAAKYPEMDLSRVGIYGVSAGGQSALRGLLAHPDFYKAGVAACGCHDNRMDKVWWNELWMGWPVGPHYAEQSNVTHAHRLQGKLLLIVGELDRNVDPASTMQVADALVKANKDFDLVVVPGAGHGIGGAYGRRRMTDFFVRHLLGAEPRRP